MAERIVLKNNVRAINRYGQAKNPSKHLVLKLRNKTLRNLVFLIEKLDSFPYGGSLKLDSHIPELDAWIMEQLDCSKRTAWEYRMSIMAILLGWS